MNFWRIVLAGLISLTAFSLLTVFLFATILSASKSGPKVPKNSILELTFDKPITERSTDNPLSGASLLGGRLGSSKDGLDDYLRCIRMAAVDKRIKGIYLNLTEVKAGWATLEALRKELLAFKKSGKFIYAYSEGYSERSYYLASTADKILLHPEGGLELDGLNITIAFYKGLTEKLGIEVVPIRHGKFKSAVEPYLRKDMSPENKMMTQEFLSDIWNNFLENISKSRNISKEDLWQMANSMAIRQPKDALDKKLVDGLMYEDEVTQELRKKLGLKDKDEVKKVSFSTYSGVKPSSVGIKEKGKDKIAVIYCVGEISSGEGDDEQIGSETTASAIREARLDDQVKAVVLRVNSPGGSALASDVIWREVILTKKAKPVIVSMGDLAASGGYYISCAANKIFAEPNTITGSIGVFGLVPNFQKMYNEKLGIYYDGVKIGEFADIGATYRPMTEKEKNIIQEEVDRTYETFITRVAEGRGITKAEVDSIGQGRVWSGIDAVKIKLVDQIGGLADAISEAEKLAKLTKGKYKTVYYPEKESFVSKILNKGAGKKQEIKTEIAKELGIYDAIKTVKEAQKGVQARMLYDYVIE
ncbi:MAG: signal peptide peptidase SppA [Bacteroidia bacterium]|nr:signal peptide peptidase SppA [Bacteroidia bacterium]MDW8348293.1 signal peptide peptidase SppA [Bacteroidia bacterium]